jgi:hypothetical protein
MVKSIHIGSSEGWVQSHHLIDDATCGPEIAFEVVWLVFPDFRAAIVRSPSLSVEHCSLLGNFGDIQVT